MTRFSVDNSCTADNVYGLPDDVTFDEVWEVCEEKGWEYGADFISEDDFTDYIQEVIQDCYPSLVPEDKALEWPYRHVTVNWDAAAYEAKADYDEVVLGGVTYLAREI